MSGTTTPLDTKGHRPSSMASVAIIGSGSVGSTIASYIIWGGAFDEVIMIDIDKDKLRGEVMDLSDATFLTDTSVKKGEFSDAKKSDIVVITAGAKQQKGETREQLLKRNVKILKSIAKSILPISESTIVLLVANPVDILTAVFQQVSGLPKERVIGSGTFLDTMRLRGALSKKLGVAAVHIHAYIVGMHGDCQTPLWSNANVSGVNLIEYGKLTKEDMKKFAIATRNKAYEIINAKGSTYYGIGACVATICRGIVQNRNQVLQLSVWNETYKSYLSWPALLWKKGIRHTLPLKLNDAETKVIHKAVKTITSEVAAALETTEEDKMK